MIGPNLHVADLFVADARGAEVGDATVGELEPGLRDVFMIAENGNTECLNAADRRIGEVERQIEVVDHQIEHDADVGGAEGVSAAA